MFVSGADAAPPLFLYSLIISSLYLCARLLISFPFKLHYLRICNIIALYYVPANIYSLYSVNMQQFIFLLTFAVIAVIIIISSVKLL